MSSGLCPSAGVLWAGPASPAVSRAIDDHVAGAFARRQRVQGLLDAYQRKLLRDERVQAQLTEVLEQWFFLGRDAQFYFRSTLSIIR